MRTPCACKKHSIEKCTMSADVVLTYQTEMLVPCGGSEHANLCRKICCVYTMDQYQQLHIFNQPHHDQYGDVRRTSNILENCPYGSGSSILGMLLIAKISSAAGYKNKNNLSVYLFDGCSDIHLSSSTTVYRCTIGHTIHCQDR